MGRCRTEADGQVTWCSVQPRVVVQFEGWRLGLGCRRPLCFFLWAERRLLVRKLNKTGGARWQLPDVQCPRRMSTKNVVQDPSEYLDVPNGLLIRIAQDDDADVAIRRECNISREARDSPAMLYDLRYRFKSTTVNLQRISAHTSTSPKLDRLQPIP